MRVKLPLRLKLTLWFLSVFAVIYFGLIGVVWVIGRGAQVKLMDEGALSVAQSIGKLLVEMEPDFNDIDLRPYQPIDRVFSVLAVRDSSGVVVASDLGVDTEALLPLPDTGQESVVRRLTGEASRRLIGRAIDTSVVTFRLVTQAGRTYYIDVARTSDVGRRQRLFFSDVLFIAGLGGLLSSTIAAWFLLGKATLPYLQLSEIARRLGLEGETRFPPGTGGAELERLQNDLNDALGRLEEGYRVRQRFLANVAHDLKTPVSVMLTQSQVLEPDRATLDEFRRYRDSVIEELRRLRGIIEGILALSRAGEGEALLRRTNVPVNTLLSQCAAHCKSDAEAAHVRLKTAMIDAVDKRELSGDVDLLCTMLDNLVRNAIRFSPPRGIVDIRAEIEDGQARITVRDHGPGIPEEYIDQIFERFIQVPSDKGKGGTGLGLAIAKTVAVAHGGSIEVRNRRRGGCAFTVTLPLSN